MKLIKNRVFQFMLLAAFVCCFQTPAVFAQPGAGAATVLDVDQGRTNTGLPFIPGRSNANNALGLPDGAFFSLGFPDEDGPGTITLGFACRIVNGPDADISIYEITTVNPYPTERAKVEALHPDGVTWVEIGVADNGNQNQPTRTDLDLGMLPYTTAIRLTDMSDPVPVMPPTPDSFADGFDVDAVVVLNGSCPPFPAGGQFVIGDLVSATPGPTGTGDIVYYWGSQWSQNNPRTGGVSPGTNSFKGFQNGNGMPACGGTWTSLPGNSTPPPAAVGSTLAIIVSSNVNKNGPVLSGNIKKILLIETLPGYSSNPGHPGRGRVLEVLCTAP